MPKLLIANRGEIARRILRTARARGFQVAVISTPEDRESVVRREADQVLEVPSFLDAKSVVEAAIRWGAEMIHPGYGFLSENPDFAELTEQAGIAFVGPTAETMRTLGNKERAKVLAESSGVPTLPSLRSDQAMKLSGKGLEKALAQRGLEPPYLVKAAGGGGGRGMRLVEKLSDLPGALERASEEAAAGFSDPTVFVERYLAEPRHVEIQIVGDGAGGGVFLGERDCSMQRRHQKVIEEAPSPVVEESLRRKMGESAMALVRSTGYRGAGTVEFLLDSAGSFYFLEVNTRLQVEHPVTEAVFGVDLVAAQLEIAEGRWPDALGSPGSIRDPSGSSIEARVLAEDPRSGFLPTPGRILRYREPAGPGIRVDSGVEAASIVDARFDSLIAKVIAWGETRAEAIDRLGRALESMVVHGPTTNLPFLQAVLRHPDFASGRVSTEWIRDHLDELNRSLLPKGIQRRLTTPGFREKLSLVVRGGAEEAQGPAARFLEIGNDAARIGSDLEEQAIRMRFDSRSGEIRLAGRDLAPLVGVATPLSESRVALTVLGETLLLEDPRSSSHRHHQAARGEGEVRAPMAGKVLELRVSPEDVVEEGTVIAVVESMKMQIEVRAPVGGRVGRVLVNEGEILDGPGLLAVIDG